MRVALSMKNERGISVISEDHPLREFTWSKGRDKCIPAFGYVRGAGQEVPLNKQGDVCMRPMITGADRGRGTYFVSRNSAVYEISVKVYGKSAGQLSPHSAKITLEDNGAAGTDTKCP